MAIHKIAPFIPSDILFYIFFDSKSQIIIDSSLLPETTLSLLTARQNILPLWPRRVVTNLLVFVSHMLINLSTPAVNIYYSSIVDSIHLISPV